MMQKNIKPYENIYVEGSGGCEKAKRRMTCRGSELYAEGKS